jgi:hypothetical protein
MTMSRQDLLATRLALVLAAPTQPRAHRSRSSIGGQPERIQSQVKAPLG